MTQIIQNIIRSFKRITILFIPKKIIQFRIRIILKLKFKKTIIEPTNVFFIKDIFKGNLKIGNHTYIWDYWRFFSRGDKIVIWKYCSIADNAYLITYNHPIDYISWHINQCNDDIKLEQEYKHWDIIIWNDVWIWHNSTILSWVTIWNWAIVAAWSVVTKNVPPYAIVWWVPAKIIKYRFSNSKIKSIESLWWYDWSNEKILENIELFNTKVSKLSI